MLFSALAGAMTPSPTVAHTLALGHVAVRGRATLRRHMTLRAPAAPPMAVVVRPAPITLPGTGTAFPLTGPLPTVVAALVLIAWVSTRVLARLSAAIMLVVSMPVARVPVVPALVPIARVSMRVRVALMRVVAVPGRRGC
nr:hypothetical protein [Microbispora rosea]